MAAAGEEILAVADLQNPAHSRFLKAFRAQLNAGPENFQISVRGHDDAPLSDERDIGLVLTVGNRAAETVDTDLPVLHALLPSLNFKAPAENAQRRSALFLDQPLLRRLNLLRLALPKRPRLGVLYGEVSRSKHETLSRVAGPDWHITSRKLEQDDELLSALREVLEQADILFTLADPLVVNRRTVQKTLLSSYRRRIPVLGISASHVRAGALLAVYSTPEQLGRQAAEAVRATHQPGGWQLPAPAYPKYFQVAVNDRVARSLDLALPDAADLSRRLQEMEPQP